MEISFEEVPSKLDGDELEAEEVTSNFYGTECVSGPSMSDQGNAKSFVNNIYVDCMTIKPTSEQPSQSFIHNDPPVDLTDDKYQLPKISRLTDMVYQAMKWVVTCATVSDLNAFRAMCNQIIYTAHRFQLFVRNLLSDLVIKNLLTKVQRTVRSF